MRLIACIATLSTLMVAAPQSAGAQGSAVPQGSFAQTCAAPYVVGGRLFANCRNTSGATVRSSIALTACSGVDVANINGVLTCGSTTGRLEGTSAPRPPAPAVSITVYSSPNFRGQSQTFTTAQSSFFATTWSHQISSMRMTGGWMACTEQNYRGRCQSFAGQVSNLRDVDMDDVIMSLRPMR